MRRFLYHGSKYNNQGKPLLPGFYVNGGVEVFWDGKFESNKYLYACGKAESAILLGIGSLTEKELLSNGFVFATNSDEVVFMFEKKDFLQPKQLVEKLKDMTMFLYTIHVKASHGWLQNKNPQNLLDDEFKTPKGVPGKDYLMTEIGILQWLTENNRKIVTTIREE